MFARQANIINIPWLSYKISLSKTLRTKFHFRTGYVRIFTIEEATYQISISKRVRTKNHYRRDYVPNITFELATYQITLSKRLRTKITIEEATYLQTCVAHVVTQLRARYLPQVLWVKTVDEQTPRPYVVVLPLNLCTQVMQSIDNRRTHTRKLRD